MDSLFLKELREQPLALARLLREQRAHTRAVGALFKRDDVRYLVVAARGSSQNAARYAQYVLGRAHRFPVALATPSLYTIYHQPPSLKGALVVGISQSGRSPDVVEVLVEARRQRRPTIAVTNQPSSPLAKAADAVLYVDAGDELAIAATKTYTNTVAAIALLYTAVAGDPVASAELDRMPDRLAAQIELTLREDIEIPLGQAEVMTVLGRGVNYPTAHEIALKIRELCGVFVEAYSPADILHGPIAALSPRAAAVIVAPSGPARDPTLAILAELRRRGVPTTVIGAVESRTQVLREFALVPDVPEWLSPLTAVVPGQVAAMRLARRLGKDVDRPAGLSKVTLTL